MSLDYKRPDYYTTAIRQEASFQTAFCVQSENDDADDECGDNEQPLGIRLHGGPQLNAQGYTGRGIKVAVIDNGIDGSHPLFHGKVTGGFKYRYGNRGEDHGTHVAGAIHMMAPEAELRDYRVFGPEGELGTVQSIANAIMDAYLDGCDLINLSIGSKRADAAIMNAIQYVQRKGVVLVAAASNFGDGDVLTNERAYPACFEETISIAAVKKEHDLPVVKSSNSNPSVDYAGIGDRVRSFQAGSHGYTNLTGTSMACPHICGLIAALMSGPNASKFRRKEGRDAKVRELLKQYTLDIACEGFDNATGLGFVTFLSRSEFNNMFGNKRSSRTSPSPLPPHRFRAPAVSSQHKDEKHPR
eukprot:CAMPEP_0178905584 /NCGR_PEP_ID=MMETSP0786-20121207/6358_1 /TAXON_ID=186022 /ORGANISM="Thalassionema frauenfeldii, Strain CCMP 1798" /LENGTH=356 /DNA_ID=CAMNT_0020577211 /DNA_START=193 /DNA_END=1260 /DNA_ORIENTATION=-